jgi:hypothetical protein
MYPQILQKLYSTEALPSNHLYVTICANHDIINLSDVPNATQLIVFITCDRGLETCPPDFDLQENSLLESSSIPKFKLPEVVTSHKDLSNG